jgi:multidrug resistance protein
MPSSVCSASHASTIIDGDRHHQPDPADFGEGLSCDKKLDPYLVRFDENDPANPKNWSSAQRWYITMTGGLLVLNATFASSAPSGMVPQLMRHFGFSEEIGTLTISLFVAGYCVGPLLWGPLSEQYGRRPIFIVTFLVYTAFQAGCALAQNTAQILVFRFLGGMFAAAPLTNSGALIADIWGPETRGKALAIFTLAPFAGPALGPTVSGYIVVAGLSWRWVFWVMTAFAGFCFLQIVFTLPETYEPVLLLEKAKRLRKETGDQNYYAPLEKGGRVSFAERLNNVLRRPFAILIHEPMLIVITIYMSFVYGCLYLLFEAYPIAFTEGHHFNAGISGLMFLPLPIGGMFAVITYLLFFNPRYERAVVKYAPNPVPPEVRLEIAIVAAPFFAISFFWFAWTSFPNISFWAPMTSGFMLGWSICWIFVSTTFCIRGIMVI